MNQPRLIYLFEAYFNKSATSGEREELMELLTNSENDEQLKLLLKETWQQFTGKNQPFKESQGDEMLVKILKKESGQNSVTVITSRRSSRWLRISTVAALLIACVGIYFWLRNTSVTRQVVQLPQSTQIIIKDSIVPGGNKAILTLSDGSHITLDSSHVGSLVKQGNAKVVNLNSATLAYKVSKDPNEKTVFNTLSTFTGGQYHVVLSDGTKVWLNASSSIYYPTVFTGNERNVTITGEVYFEVAKNAVMPFKVKVRDMQVQVLGTYFNIMAYDEENSINTTLLKGSVLVSKGDQTKLLVPGQESRINNKGNIKIVEADVEEVMAWKNGWFQFNAVDIEKVMRQISRWYNVEVVYEGKVPTGHFTGSVSRENNISQVLKIMEAGGVKFKIEGRKIIVASDKPYSS